MTINRRRFLAISAAACTAGTTRAPAHRWQGLALGAEVSMVIHGPDDIARPALAAAQGVLRAVEGQFSLFDEASVLSRLNRSGRLPSPDQMFVSLCRAADHIHYVTDGLFDPTVQPLWQALAAGQGTDAARRAIGWDRVRYGADAITLGAGQALTFNGIAQGFATDLVADLLQQMGLTDTLVNIGEYRGQGGPWRLSLEDPAHGRLGTRSLTTGAIATSSPMAMPMGGQGHILHPTARPLWSTVAVEAASATIADGLSTALTMIPKDRARALLGRDGVTRITLVDRAGDLTTLSV